MKVLKFGGTSVAGVAELREVAAIVEASRREGPTLVVVSAIRGVTDDLQVVCRRSPSRVQAVELRSRLLQRHLYQLDDWLLPDDLELLRERLEPELDRLERALLSDDNHHEVLAAGERLSVIRLAACLRRQGLWVESFDGTRVLRLDSAGTVHRERLEEGLVALGETVERCGTVALVPGFIASDEAGRTVTLGRGASDLSATALSALLGAVRVEIWTDTAGILTADPRYVRGAVTLKRLHADEATALARYGARVLHPDSLVPLRGLDLAIRILSTMDRNHEGTEIGQEAMLRAGARPRGHEVRAVTVLELEEEGVWPDHSAAVAAIVPPGEERETMDLIHQLSLQAGRRVLRSSVESAGPSRLVVVAVSGGAAEELLPLLHDRVCQEGRLPAVVSGRVAS